MAAEWVGTDPHRKACEWLKSREGTVTALPQGLGGMPIAPGGMFILLMAVVHLGAQAPACEVSPARRAQSWRCSQTPREEAHQGEKI